MKPIFFSRHVGNGMMALCMLLVTGSLALAQSRSPITANDVNKAQQAWCDGLVMIGKLHSQGGDYRGFADKFLDDLYDFREGKVFFKPTLAVHPRQFRKTKAGALAYFIGDNPDFPEDDGFAFAPWVKVRYDNAGADNEGIQIHGEIALAMGNVYLTDAAGNEIMVDKTFVFRRGSDGKLRLIAHKSALPFTPNE